MPFSLNDVVLVDLAVPASKANKNALVIIEQVNKFYGDLHVLKDINTTVARGEVVVVIGPSGSGKSTLCRAINRLETIDSGSYSSMANRSRKRARSSPDFVPTLEWFFNHSISLRTKPPSKM